MRSRGAIITSVVAKPATCSERTSGHRHSSQARFSELENQVEWLAALVSVGSLGVAGLSVWLAMRNRGAAHRQHLYEKQVDAFDEVHIALNALAQACQGFIGDRGFRLDSVSRVELRVELSQGSMADAYHNFGRVCRRWALFLPASAQAAIADFNKVLMGISAPDEVAHQYPQSVVHSDDPQMILSDAQGRVTAALRDSLGVDPLSDEIMQLVGTSREKQMDRIVRKGLKPGDGGATSR